MEVGELTESCMVEEAQWPRTNMEEKLTQCIHTVVKPMFNPTMMKEVAISEPGILTMMECQSMDMFIPECAQQVGINPTTKPLQMKVGGQMVSPLMVEVLLSMAGYKFKSVVMSTVMEEELIKSRCSVVLAVSKLPIL